MVRCIGNRSPPRAAGSAAFSAVVGRSLPPAPCETPSTAARSSTLAAMMPRRPPNRASRRWRRFGADAVDLLQRATPLRALARRARMPVIAKRCASSRICAISMQRRRLPPRRQRRATVGEHQRLQADLARLALGDADQHRRRSSAEVLRTPRAPRRPGRRAAVDQHQVRHRAVALGELRVAPRQHLAHRRRSRRRPRCPSMLKRRYSPRCIAWCW